MKTRLFLVAALMIAGLTMGYAKDPSSNQVKLKNIINHEISYPEEAIDQKIQGDVTVEFTVTEEGKIKVINCYTDQGVFYNYVLKTMEKIRISPDEELTGKTFSMKLNFKLD